MISDPHTAWERHGHGDNSAYHVFFIAEIARTWTFGSMSWLSYLKVSPSKGRKTLATYDIAIQHTMAIALEDGTFCQVSLTARTAYHRLEACSEPNELKRGEREPLWDVIEIGDFFHCKYF